MKHPSIEPALRTILDRKHSKSKAAYPTKTSRRSENGNSHAAQGTGARTRQAHCNSDGSLPRSFCLGMCSTTSPALCGWRAIAKFGSSVGSAGQPRKSRRLLHIKRRQAGPRRTAAGNWTKRKSKRIPTASGYRELRLDAFRQGLLTCAHEGSAKMS
jgi:hypothetical protein